MIISKTVIVIPSGRSTQHWKEKGYKFEYKKPLEVNVEDLQLGSGVYVEVECDFCHERKQVKYSDYNRSVKKDGLYACCHCVYHKSQKTMFELYGAKFPINIPKFAEKQKETNLQKYGVENPFQNKEIQEKIAQTNLNKYGAENPFGSPIIQEKIKETNLDKYGVENPFASPIIQEKIRETNIKKYGVPSPMQSEEIIEKTQKTNLERYGKKYYVATEEHRNRMRQSCLDEYGYEYYAQVPEIKEKIKNTSMQHYGVEYTLQSPIVREKINQTLYLNNAQKSSIQQRYICNLFDGDLNYPIGKYCGDIVFQDEKTIIECDFSGHKLQILKHQLTEEEFNKKEYKRFYFIKGRGYKQIHFISETDKLPSDEKLLEILELSKQYFSDYPNHSWINWYFDEGIYKNAENKDGVPFDFGKLRKIKKEDVNNGKEAV